MYLYFEPFKLVAGGSIMCELTQVTYMPGDVVWVKLGSCWWPGEVKDMDTLPEEIISNLKKKPLAVVKFFSEDS